FGHSGSERSESAAIGHVSDSCAFDVLRFCDAKVKTRSMGSKRASIKRPISVPWSSSSAVECYPCREVPLNYNRSLLFHGGDPDEPGFDSPYGTPKLSITYYKFRFTPRP